MLNKNTIVIRYLTPILVGNNIMSIKSLPPKNKIIFITYFNKVKMELRTQICYCLWYLK